ncbi:MAG: hypothetical protein C5B51_08870 [Terriglobia bacterium]|nr:MAG: hypothetical protein C5B51_08870 [Terriglobia bacterium]
MSSSNWRIITLAAMLAVAFTTAQAQVTLKAQVPFSFTAGSDKIQQPGGYSITNEGSVWYIRGDDSRQTTLALPRAVTRSSHNNPPKLVFHCRTVVCSLYAIEKAGGDGALFSEPKRDKDEANKLARIVVVPLTSSNAE